MTNHLMSFMVSTARLTPPTYEHGLSQRLIRLRSDSECIAPSMRNHALQMQHCPITKKAASMSTKSVTAPGVLWAQKPQLSSQPRRC